MRTLAGFGVLTALLGCAFGAAAPRPAGTWVGSLRLPAASEASALSVELRGGQAQVVLAPGHAARTVVAARATSGRLRFSLPSRTGPIRFDLRLKGRRLAGSVRQGAVRGTATLGRGRALEAGTLGLYDLGDGRTLGVVQGFGQRAGVVYEADEIRGLYARSPAVYDVGSGLATRAPVVGTATFAADAAVWLGTQASRVVLRQEQVRVPAGRHSLACTLTLPPGEGRRPAVAFAHGSGPALRSFNSTFALFFARHGHVVLSCDKRGVGQSGGDYLGERASEQALDGYARDVEAQARWLAAQPEVDSARVGLSGASQAGWIMPLAASREPAIRWLVLLVSPTVTVGESDLWGDLAGQGRFQPARTDEELLVDVRRSGPSGFDPLPSIRTLRIPAVWIFGGNDRHVPTRLSVERLEPVTREAGRDVSYVVFPRANHGLVESEHGLDSEVVQSSRYASGLWRTIASWLRARGLAT